MIITTNNIHSVSNASNSAVDQLSSYGAFQQTTVGSSNVTIRTIVYPRISAKPYLKIIIAILSYRHIHALSTSSSNFFAIRPQP